MVNFFYLIFGSLFCSDGDAKQTVKAIEQKYMTENGLAIIARVDGKRHGRPSHSGGHPPDNLKRPAHVLDEITSDIGHEDPDAHEKFMNEALERYLREPGNRKTKGQTIFVHLKGQADEVDPDEEHPECGDSSHSSIIKRHGHHTSKQNCGAHHCSPSRSVSSNSSVDDHYCHHSEHNSRKRQDLNHSTPPGSPKTRDRHHQLEPATGANTKSVTHAHVHYHNHHYLHGNSTPPSCLGELAHKRHYGSVGTRRIGYDLGDHVSKHSSHHVTHSSPHTGAGVNHALENWWHKNVQEEGSHQDHTKSHHAGAAGLHTRNPFLRPVQNEAREVGSNPFRSHQPSGSHASPGHAQPPKHPWD